MVDRIDIDALLIGSLYGELSSTDEARLRAHLESHPADRTALDGLVRTRDAVRASRIFEVSAEPPQSVSALLMQEAVRRAPKAPKAEPVGEGWFARLRRSLLLHPAMAAAAMLVIVAGVARMVYVRKGDNFAAPEVAAVEKNSAAGQPMGRAELAPEGAAAPVTATAVPAADDSDQAADPRARAQLAVADSAAAPAKIAKATRDADAYRVGLADGKYESELQKKAEPAPPAAAPAPEPATGASAPAPGKAARSAGPGSLLEVSTPRLAPKELDEEARARPAKGRAQQDFAKPADESPLADPSVNEKRGDAMASRAPTAAPPPPAATVAQGMAKAPVGGAPGAAGGAAGGEEVNVDGNLAWAREQHTRLITQVRAGHCDDAAGTAVALSTRAPGYYQQNVETDRSVKNCMPLINAERERVERARARAVTVRRNNEEAAAPAAKQAAKKAAPAKPAAADSNATKTH